MDLIVTPLVWTHVAAGMIALLTAPAAMLTRKGGSAHRRLGRVYVWAMGIIFVTALGLLAFRPNFFLLMVSIFSFYGALSGYRALHRRRPERGQGPTLLDRGAALLALGAGLAFIGWGATSLLGLLDGGRPLAFALIAIAFGASLGHDGWSDLRSFGRPAEDRLWWWYYHMNRMIGSYIAAVTAFLVQNVGPHLPPDLRWLVWVAPAVVGVPLIGLWIGHYRRRFGQRPPPGAAAAPGGA